MAKTINGAALTSNHSKLVFALFALITTSSAIGGSPTVWVTPIKGGEALFYDWGYSGPQGQNAGQWESNGVFDGAAQIQHVITTETDRLTPDVSYQHIQTEFDIIPWYRDPNMDTQVNFFKWGYTTTGGSTFDNMQIDVDGDYLIHRDDMQFNYYNTFNYQYEGDVDINSRPNNASEGIHATLIQFQPYALSDARGWCGSITASNPAALEAMAGQVTFDFGFEAFLPSSPKDGNGIGIPGQGALQIVKDFQMRSYGSLEINVSLANGGVADLVFKADAVVNNTNPVASTIPASVPIDPGTGEPETIIVPVLNMDGSPALDANNNPRTMEVPQKAVGGGGVDGDYYNKVSFMGGGIVPVGVWVEVADNTASVTHDNIVRVINEGLLSDGSPEPLNSNVVYHNNSFKGYPFLLRADGIRVLDAMDFNYYSNLAGIPASSFDGDGNLLNLEGNIVADLGDSDGDGVSDSVDNCPNTANPGQDDSGGVDSNTPDGIGDACQCGDISGDGKITNTDSVLIKRHLLGLPSNFQADFCDVNGDGQCTNTDAVIINRTLLGMPPGIAQTCPAAI